RRHRCLRRPPDPPPLPGPPRDHPAPAGPPRPLRAGRPPLARPPHRRSSPLTGPLKKAHLGHLATALVIPRPYAQRTESTPRVRPSSAASHLDLFERPAQFSPPA